MTASSQASPRARSSLLAQKPERRLVAAGLHGAFEKLVGEDVQVAGRGDGGRECLGARLQLGHGGCVELLAERGERHAQAAQADAQLMQPLHLARAGDGGDVARHMRQAFEQRDAERVLDAHAFADLQGARAHRQRLEMMRGRGTDAADGGGAGLVHV